MRGVLETKVAIRSQSSQVRRLSLCFSNSLPAGLSCKRCDPIGEGPVVRTLRGLCGCTHARAAMKPTSRQMAALRVLHAALDFCHGGMEVWEAERCQREPRQPKHPLQHESQHAFRWAPRRARGQPTQASSTATRVTRELHAFSPQRRHSTSCRVHAAALPRMRPTACATIRPPTICQASLGACSATGVHQAGSCSAQDGRQASPCMDWQETRRRSHAWRRFFRRYN